jgi:hypothetical protein
MKVLRILAALIFLLGAVYVATSMLMLLSVDHTSQLTGMSGGLQPGADLAFRRRLTLAAVALVVIGLPSLVGSVGLFLAREWARRSWPFIAALAVLAHVAWFILDLLRGSVELRDWLALAATISVYVAAAVYLARPATRALFQR